MKKSYVATLVRAVNIFYLSHLRVGNVGQNELKSEVNNQNDSSSDTSQLFSFLRNANFVDAQSGLHNCICYFKFVIVLTYLVISEWFIYCIWSIHEKFSKERIMLQLQMKQVRNFVALWVQALFLF